MINRGWQKRHFGYNCRYEGTFLSWDATWKLSQSIFRALSEFSRCRRTARKQHAHLQPLAQQGNAPVSTQVPSQRWDFSLYKARDSEWATNLERAPPVRMPPSLIWDALSKPVAHSVSLALYCKYISCNPPLHYQNNTMDLRSKLYFPPTKTNQRNEEGQLNQTDKQKCQESFWKNSFHSTRRSLTKTKHRWSVPVPLSSLAMKQKKRFSALSSAQNEIR